MTYMPYVDGLRAVAIIMVFVFHLNPQWLTGGFIGVDIFFVISGFLITQIIWKAYEKQTFNYFTFIWSRCKRLLPAYTFVIICTAIAASFILLPHELKAFATSVLYAVPFLSNILFYKKSNYFEDAAETFPLLHTWSLAVEWQFYLFFPFILYFIYRFLAQYISGLFIAAIALFAAVSVYVTELDPSLAFYISLFRGGEFLIGGLVFFLIKNGQVKGKRILASVSFLLLCVISVVLSKEDLFPGYWASIVALFTATLILGLHNDQRFILCRLLSSGVATYFGKISYSFYLWHWPVILFAKYYYGDIATIEIVFGITVVTLVAAVFSFTYVENSFRKTTSSKSLSNYPIAALVIYAVVMIAPAYGLINTNGLSNRLSSIDKKILSVPRWQNFPGTCEYTQQQDKYFGCIFGDQTQQPNILLWGDSHAQVFAWNYDASAKALNKSVLSYSKGGCAPLLNGVLRNTLIDKNICLAMQEKVINLLKQNNNITDVILAGRWNGYMGREFVAQGNVIANQSFIAQLNATIIALQALGKTVHLIDTIPQPGYRVPETIVRERLLFNTSSELEHFNYVEESVVNAQLLAGVNKNKLIIHHPKDYLCNDGLCSVIAKDKPLYFDADHLSVYGVEKLQQVINETLQ